MRQAWLSLLGVLSLIALLAIAWRFAVTLTAVPRPIMPSVGKPDEEVWVTQGQLVTEVPERREVWTLRFHRGRYDPKTQTALTEKSVCQVKRKGRIVTLFSAPHIFVRFKERVMVMEGGVTVVGKLVRLKVQLPRLTWDWGEGRLRGLGPIRLDGEWVTGTAEGMEGDTTLQQLHLLHPQLRWHRPTHRSSRGAIKP